MKSTPKDNIIATAALLGGVPVYYDYGHPERATARMYWTINDGRAVSSLGGCRLSSGTVYGYTREDCARRWLKSRFPDVPVPK